MNNKVKFLRGTSGEYAVAEKDSDTIYFTTDDGKLYIGDKEISGDGSITIDDTLSDTSTNPVQGNVIKQAIDNKADKSLYGDTTINVGRKAGTDVGQYSIVIGHNSSATKQGAVAEGMDNTASGIYSHAEGMVTTASGYCSHSEGMWSTADGEYAHAGGKHSNAIGYASFAHGYYVNAYSSSDKNAGHAAFGMYNSANTHTLFSIGDGTADDARHNAFEITTDGGKLHDKDIATTDLIPTELPANGGNADTVGGLHADDFAKSTNPIINGDMIFERDSSQQTISAIYSAADTLVLRNKTKDASSFCDVMIGNDGVRIVNANQNFKIGDGGNADTVDGLHAEKFMRYEPGRNLTTSINDMITPGTYGVYSITPDFPAEYGAWGLLEVQAYGSICYQIIKFESGIIIIRAKIVNQTEWTKWKEISTTPIKSTGWITSPTDQYGAIILPNSSTRRYLSIIANGCYAEMLIVNNECTVHIKNGIYEAIINTPITYIAFYIE